MKKLITLILFVPLMAFSQVDSITLTDSIQKGIKFITASSWSEILAKAQKEGKYIFLDCYTTWCAPCKAMEKNIYPLPNVGDFFNKHFISVKIQMDRTEKDDQLVKDWYDEAKRIQTEYQIDAFPTYLFLSAEGKPVHRAAGAFNDTKFLLIASDALNFETQSYTLLATYKPETIATQELKRKARAIRYACPELAKRMVIDYLNRIPLKELFQSDNLKLLSEFKQYDSIRIYANRYIASLNEVERMNEINIRFMTEFLTSSNDASFKFLKKNEVKIDDILNKGKRRILWWYTYKWIDQVIYKEEVEEYMNTAKDKNATPNWERLKRVIASKYDLYTASRIISSTKVSWFKSRKDWLNYSKQIVEYVEIYGKDLDDLSLNNYAWAIFSYSQDSTQLTRALSWSNRAVDMNPYPNWIDTKANIMYKLGQKDEAIDWQIVASRVYPSDLELKETLEKMKKGEPTWPISVNNRY